ncbi:hypothetical protein HDU87_008792 [Geranomyces variabilis]|uniref:Uncharacterized protein n=1 Tax=Geranomyces variabilis TaxID=109894 RepID=A0AAD5XLY0_9FUNG|nr:hypothetical protein HDU87_008792 [Geranomyces variabilis]
MSGPSTFNMTPEDLEMLSSVPPSASISTASASEKVASGRPQSARAAKAEAVKIKAEAAEPCATPAPPAGPDGRMAQLLMYQSGKMQMRMGQIVLDVISLELGVIPNLYSLVLCV